MTGHSTDDGTPSGGGTLVGHEVNWRRKFDEDKADDDGNGWPHRAHSRYVPRGCRPHYECGSIVGDRQPTIISPFGIIAQDVFLMVI